MEQLQRLNELFHVRTSNSYCDGEVLEKCQHLLLLLSSLDKPRDVGAGISSGGGTEWPWSKLKYIAIYQWEISINRKAKDIFSDLQDNE